MSDQVCSLPELGQNLERARVSAGVKDSELAEAVGVNLSTLGRWKAGVYEPGARLLALAALRCQSTPNDLLLRASLPGGEFHFDNEDLPFVSRAAKTMHRLKALRPDGGVIPWEMFANVLDEIERNFEARGFTALPPGSVIAEPEPGVQTYVPPPPTTKRRLRNDSPVKLPKVSELIPVYGKKKPKE